MKSKLKKYGDKVDEKIIDRKYDSANILRVMCWTSPYKIASKHVGIRESDWEMGQK